MKPEEIKFTDWARIMAGNVPPEFYLELVIRAFFIYLLLMVSMRLMGKRMSTQVSRLELATMTALASAIGVPMLSMDRGLLPAVIIAAVTILIHRLVVLFSFTNEKFERASQGSILPLVEEGTMHYKSMKKGRITRERLFAQMRSDNIVHLGAVERFYLEPNGSFALIKNPQNKPGLLVLPEADQKFISKKVEVTNQVICQTCGMPATPNVKNEHSDVKCKNCHHHKWTRAVIEKTG